VKSVIGTCFRDGATIKGPGHMAVKLANAFDAIDMASLPKEE